MHRIRISRISLAVVCAIPVMANAQQGLKLTPQRGLLTMTPAQEASTPVFIEADQLQGQSETEAEASGAVRLRRHGQSVSADWLRYDFPTQQLDASGNIKLERGTDLIEGDRLRYNLGTQHGFMETPKFRITPPPRETVAPGTPPDLRPFSPLPWDPPHPAPVQGRGTAERILFQGPELFRAEQSSYTTCGPGNDDWFIRSRELDIDKGREVGIARGASIEFLDHTIFYTPYISFALHNQRTSGILTPHYGSSTTTGTEITVPYYWNMAPNRDMTFYPRLMSKRGLQLGTEFRYLGESYRGNARIEVLPNDSQLNRERHSYFLQHTQRFGDEWSAALNLNRVSDDRYFTDLSTLIAVTSRTTLPTEALIARTAPWGDAGTYSFTAQALKWQTLQPDPLAPVTPPYDRKPQLTFSAFRQDVFHTDFDVFSSYVDFSHPTLPSGKRLIAYPNFSLPLQTASAFFVPRIGAHLSRYTVEPNTQGFTDQTRTLPVVTADAGLIFERDTVLTGLPFRQTLEPRLYYVYIPFRDQTHIPNFESGPLDVSFATLFTENQFTGHDRINDANQITAGLSSRFIHPDSGIERLRVAIAQRYYFQDQRVTLPGVPARPANTAASDVLAAVSGTIVPNWTVDLGFRYNSDQGEIGKFNVATRYQPTPGRVLNVAYRETAELIQQTDVSFQWPITPQWTALGRWTYSLRDGRTLEALGGFEYDGGCWVFRAVAHHFVTALNASSTSVFLQLELNGVSRIGTNPTDVLRRSVGGYSTRVDPRAPRVGEFQDPDR
jgi:LPS-assembly protein